MAQPHYKSISVKHTPVPSLGMGRFEITENYNGKHLMVFWVQDSSLDVHGHLPSAIIKSRCKRDGLFTFDHYTYMRCAADAS